ncbi:MAG TPA: glycosyltransferase [Spirochaetota bacterium]|nr:glycosyltransferase [Spirochaetota bacterium]
MGKKFERALLLCPAQYSLSNSLLEILSHLAEGVKHSDIRSAISGRTMKFNSQAFRLPHGLRRKWEKHFLERVNERILRQVKEYNPDLVLIYNSLYMVPETCRFISSMARLVFFMGDSPFYTPQNNYYLSCLPHADLILSPDSYWQQQLVTMGLERTVYFMPGVDKSSYFRLLPDCGSAAEGRVGVLYVGSCYLNSWGYKKALLMSSFTRFNFRLYGNSAWRRWFPFFPDLERVFSESGFISQADMNRMYNNASVIPVDGNPGIISGVHLRMFEALAAGALPLIEHRNDVDGLIFRGLEEELPLIRDYRKAGDIAEYFLKNERERADLVNRMDAFLAREYSHELNAIRLAEALAR